MSDSEIDSQPELSVRRNLSLDAEKGFPIDRSLPHNRSVGTQLSDVSQAPLPESFSRIRSQPRTNRVAPSLRIKKSSQHVRASPPPSRDGGFLSRLFLSNSAIAPSPSLARTGRVQQPTQAHNLRCEASTEPSPGSVRIQCESTPRTAGYVESKAVSSLIEKIATILIAGALSIATIAIPLAILVGVSKLSENTETAMIGLAVLTCLDLVLATWLCIWRSRAHLNRALLPTFVSILAGGVLVVYFGIFPFQQGNSDDALNASPMLPVLVVACVLGGIGLGSTVAYAFLASG